jgi:predicted small lipoprotein YifL
MKMRNALSTLLVAALLSATMMTAACERKGPGEKAGEKIDKATDKVADTINPKGPAEKAGRAVARAGYDKH